MDIIDKKIVERLSFDARTPFLSIARELSVSEGTIRQRVAKLLKRRVIKKFTIELGTSTTALIEIVTSSSVPTQRISEKLKKFGITKIYEVAGRFTIFVILQTDDLNKLNIILESIRSIDGVIQTETFPVLTEH